MPIWNPQVETMPRAQLQQLQLERLQATVNRIWDSVPYYRRRFEELGLMPEHVRSLDDLRLLPFTVKDDLRAGYPYDLFALPLREVVRIHASSAATGQPTVVGYTRNDLRNWGELVARVLSAGGATKDDVIQVSFSYGLLTDAFGFHQGAEEIGASVIPVSAGAPQHQLKIMRDFRTTALVGTPTDALRIAESLEDLGIPRSSLHLRWAMLGSAPWPETVRTRIQAMLGVSAADNYAVSEVMGPGIAGECEGVKDGLHINEDHFLCEIVDPDSGEVLPSGETGELVITTITKEAIPIVRYRTRDLTALNPEPCPCGRTLARMARVFSRTDDMLIIGGVKVFPAQVEQALGQVGGVEPHYRLIVEQVDGVDRVEVQVEVSPGLLTGDVGRLLKMENALRRRLEADLGISAELKLVEPRTIGPVDHPAQRIVDRRRTEGGDRPKPE